MKKILAGLFILGGLFVSAVGVKANEGRIVLENKGVRCEGVSVWRDGQYKIMGKCYGLQYPYKGEYDRYYLWAEDAKKDVDVRIVEIKRGYFEGFVFNNFSKIFVTAEKKSAPRKPSRYVVMSGQLQMFEMPEGRQEIMSGEELDKSETKTMTVQNKVVEPKKTSSGSSTVGRVIGRILLSLLIIVFVVVGMVIVGSLIFRKRGSVS